MSDLYRRDMSASIDVVTYDIKGGIIEYDGADELLTDLEEAGVLIKVEPCIHRNYAGHIIGGQGGQHPWIATTATGEPHWCDGTPEKDTHTPFEQSIIDAVESGTLSDRDGLHILGYEGDG